VQRSWFVILVILRDTLDLTDREGNPATLLGTHKHLVPFAAEMCDSFVCQPWGRNAIYRFNYWEHETCP